MTTPLSLVKICLLTKNEKDMIEDFILFYGSLFGYENLCIIDNGSTAPQVLDVYERYKMKGITVIVDSRDLNHHGSIMTEYMSKLAPTCKYIIPLDTDEFIFFTDGSAITKEKLMDYFLSIPDNVSVVRFQKFYGSIPDLNSSSYVNHRHKRPTTDITDFYDQNWDKLFVRADRFISCAVGNHSVQTTFGDRIISDKLGLLHFHETGVGAQFERAMQAVEGRGHVRGIDPIPKQIEDALRFMPGIGGHHCKIYLKYITRLHLINEWIARHGRDTLPSPEDMLWLYKVYDRLDILKLVSQYISLSIPTEENKNYNLNDLMFNHWPEIPKEFKITSVSDYLLSLGAP